jgi:hypothetical protein
MTPSLDLEEVRHALDARQVLDFYAWTYKRAGSELESGACPARADHSRRRAFVVSARTGRWQCFPCGTKGDLFTFIAQVEKKDLRSDFPAVLAKAAEIAGVGPSTPDEHDRQLRREEIRRQREQREAAERAERERMERDAVPIATSYWSMLPSEHQRGVEYLRERGLGGAVACDIVRFDIGKYVGSPSLALFTSRGEIRNVVRRCLPEIGEPKTPGLYDCPTAGTLIGSLREVYASDRDVVVTEGVMDSVTAVLAFEHSIVLGAHGAGNLPDVIRAAARAVVKIRTRLYLVPHHDDRGYECSLEGAELALEEGLSVRARSLVIVRHGEKDLNDAWRRGWRPAA